MAGDAKLRRHRMSWHQCQLLADKDQRPSVPQPWRHTPFLEQAFERAARPTAVQAQTLTATAVTQTEIAMGQRCRLSTFTRCLAGAQHTV